MPVYVYRNLRTDETFEIEQRITEPALTEHPETGDPVKRLIQPVGIAFKGSGFYVTDSRGSNGKTEPAKTESANTESAKTEPAKTGSAKTESGGGSGESATSGGSSSDSVSKATSSD